MFTHFCRATERIWNDRLRALNPNYKTPFSNVADAFERLSAYHTISTDADIKRQTNTMQATNVPPVVKQSDVAEANESSQLGIK